MQNDYYSIRAGNITLLKGIVRDGNIYNAPGQEIVAKRNEVCDDKELGCEAGLHAGSVEYATDYASGRKVVIVEIDPANVVSIPTDCNCQKLRTCAYKVVGELPVEKKAGLGDDYCDDYCDCDDDSDNNDDYCDGENDETDEDERREEALDAAFSDGFDQGYVDGLDNNGFDDVT